MFGENNLNDNMQDNLKGTAKNKRWGKFIFGFVTGFTMAILIVIGLNLQVANKFQLHSKSASSSNAEESKESIDFTAVENKVNTIQQLINKFYLNKIDYDKMESGIYSGLVASLGDPYSTYYTKEEFDLLMESTKGTYSGIGALLSQDPKTGIVSIIKVYEGTPSEEAGLQEGDMIYKVDDIEITGMDLAEAVTHIKGKESSKVDLTIAREGESDYLKFEVERRKINVPTVTSKMLEDKVGYIAVSEFDEVTYDQYTKALDQLIEDGMKGLVIDLRNNPGGNLDIVCKMVDEILGKGLIVYIEDKYGKREEFNSDANNKLKVPLAVLINGNSASASEIFAGAVKDYKIGTLVGTKTFGKGIVQQLIDLKDGSAMKLTIASYFTPSGVNIHGVGIKPDEEVELNENAKKDNIIKPEEDNQLQKAIEIVTK